MVCNNYLPSFQKQLSSGDPLGGFNCTAYSGAMAGNYDTCGSKRPIGRMVRYYTGDRYGGTTLPQIDYALNRGWGIDLDTRIGSSKLTWPQFVSKINSGRGAILQGSYDALYNTRFSGSRSFTGNHAIFVPPKWKVMDPLCDGRRAGIYKYHGEVYPQDLIRRFAGRLVLSPSAGHRLGLGYVWCSLTRDNTTTIITARVPAGAIFIRYKIVNNIIVDYTKFETIGFSGTCTRPNNYIAKDGLPFTTRSLVKMTSGIHKGAYISSKYSSG